MTSNSTNSAALQSPAEAAIPLLDDWFDPIEAGRRDRVRGFIQGMIEAELEAALSRRRYARRQRRLPRMLMARAVSPATAWPPIAVAAGDLRAGRDRGAAGPARHRAGQDNRVEEHDVAGLPAANQAGRFRRSPAPIWPAPTRVGCAGRCQRCSAARVGKDTVSRVWRKVKADWDAWNGRSLAEEPIVRVILDGTVVRVRLDRKAHLDRAAGRARRA